MFTHDHPCTTHLLNFYAGNYNTRYNNANNLAVPIINSNLGRQSITYLGPKSNSSVPPETWQNSASIRTFKSKLKTLILTPLISYDLFFVIVYVTILHL